MKSLITLSTLSAILIIRYMAMAWVFEKVSGKLTPIDPSPVNEKAKAQDFRYSLYSSLIFAASGTYFLYAYESGRSKIYLDVHEYGYPYLILSVLLYLFIHDTYYYWMHRVLHQKKFYRFHYVHHVSRRPTPWTSFSFHPVEAILQAIFIPLMTLWIPIHAGALIAILMIMTFFGFTNHLGAEIYPQFFEKSLFLITASHHQKHHQAPNKNFGLYFTTWDKWLKTETTRST